MNAVPQQRIRDALNPDTRPSKFWDQLERTTAAVPDDPEARMSYAAAIGIVNGLRP
ncbi:hypothetical protein OS122_02755 [Mycolicibacterium mucogenicum]|uniref:hypothetical protein n=1 Tax=Mycolicibacterium mucogenicum TaxID=56689 RepID=UPI002269E58A|nr:hypothetical protein [Mycolicibacterium mucogenicum]MCX8559819.1 hypothetical protein [Mycolicibacterium mucogenicum]